MHHRIRNKTDVQANKEETLMKKKKKDKRESLLHIRDCKSQSKQHKKAASFKCHTRTSQKVSYVLLAERWQLIDCHH